MDNNVIEKVNELQNAIDNIKSSQKKQPKTKDALLKALEQDFATTVNKFHINSCDKEFSMREVKVQEQKTLSRIMLNNSLRKDIIYDAQCALINQVVLEDGFDIYDYTEFDKIKALMIVYQSSMLKKDITFTCKHCGADNKYNADYKSVIEKLDKLDVADKTFSYSTATRKFDFVASYPSVRRVSSFYRQYLKNNKVNKDNKDQQETNMNFDYVYMYVKSVKITDISTGALIQDIDFNEFGPLDVEDLIAVFPYEVVYNESGLLTFITKQFINTINEQFEQHVCLQCGEKHEEEVDSAKDFL